MDVFFGPLAIIYNIVRFILILLDAVLVFVFTYAAIELYSMRPRFVFDPRKAPKHHPLPHASHEENPTSAWNAIKKKAETGTPESIRLAIIEADGFVDSILKKKGYEGDTFADRLSKVDPVGMESLNDLWEAHRLRNDIVHTPGFSVPEPTALQALRRYEAFLREMGVLELAGPAHHEPPPDIPFLEIPTERG